ncbi:MAG TPA: TonB-dependent receptor [Kofleriaceae bacterium]|nr:TonB-dependent receptor [Kofleriaceae bacterium]
MLRRKRSRTLAFSFLAVTAAISQEPIAALAGEPGEVEAEEEGKVAVESLTLDSLLDLESSVATKEKRPIERTPATVSVMTDQQIREYGWITINDVLAQVPGYARGQDFERRVMTNRGNPETWNADRNLILVDGTPFNDVEVDGAYTWEATSLAFFKKVDILRGPASAVYGTNALNGVVGLETLSVEDLGGAGVRASVKLATDATAMSVVGGQRTELVDFVVGAASFNRTPDPYRDYDGSERTGSDGELGRFLVHDSRRQYHLMAKLDGREFLDGMTFSIHLQDGSFETGHGWFEHIPDAGENYNESRVVSSLRYRHKVGRLSFDHIAQLQRQQYDSKIRFYENDALDGFYPDGVTEQLVTDLERLFMRSQVSLDLGRKASFLAGAEYAVTFYNGDDVHSSNANLGHGDEPFGEFRELGAMYQPIVDRPVTRVAAFGQLVSGSWLGEKLELTAGARYDGLIYDYVPMTAPDGPAVSDGFHEVSPRIGLVATPTDWLALKAMAGRAFRTPAIIELFASNTWSAGANPTTLQPERDTTYEVAMDLSPRDWLRWRSNGFYSHRENHISYADGVSDILTNLYSNERVGVESELLGEVEVGKNRVGAHASVSYVKLVDEETLNPQVAASKELVNAPALLVKAGARFSRGRVTLSGEAYAQGPTRRRASALVTPAFREVRPDEVPSFINFDAAAFVQVAGGLRLGATATNLLDRRSRVIAPFDTGFDFRVDPRRIFVVLELQQ